MTFLPGDVVKLKSGGFNMTVCSVNRKEGRYTCDWHATSGEAWQGYYVAEQLEIVQTAPLPDVVNSVEGLGVANFVPQPQAKGMAADFINKLQQDHLDNWDKTQEK